MDFQRVKPGQYLVLSEKALWAAAADFYYQLPVELQTKDMSPRPQEVEVSILTHKDHDNIMSDFPRMAGFVLSKNPEYHVELVFHLSQRDLMDMADRLKYTVSAEPQKYGTIKSAALQARGGTWAIEAPEEGSSHGHWIHDGSRRHIADNVSPANAEFITEASPTAVIALVNDYESELSQRLSAEAKVAELEGKLEAALNQLSKEKSLLEDGDRLRHLVFYAVDANRDEDVSMLTFGPYPSGRLRQAIDADMAAKADGGCANGQDTWAKALRLIEGEDEDIESLTHIAGMAMMAVQELGVEALSLEGLNAEKVNPTLLSTLLRATCLWSEELRGWKEARQIAERILSDRGQDPTEVMYGMF